MKESVMRKRNWTRLGALVAGTVLMMTTAVLAEGSEAHPELLAKPETAVPAMIASLIMFGLLIFILKKLSWGPILKGIADRETKIRTEIEAAENARAQATQALDDYQQELAKARGEANAMIQQARGDALRVGEELRAKNEAELIALKKKATGEIEAAKRDALNAIYQEAATLSTQIAGRILGREFKASDHAKLVQESLSQLDSLGADGTKN
jgi:F-type H+-transporting ATPase subunit b